MQHQKRSHAHLLTLGLVGVHDASALALAHANVLFHRAPDPSLYARNTMLKPLLLNGDFAKPLELYRLSLDNCTHFYVPKVRAKLREGRIGLRVRAHVAKLGFLAKRVVQGRCLMICLDEMNRLGLL